MSLTVKIKKKLGNFQLDIDFNADQEIMALLGASGCGKSLTLKCIAGIEKPDEGRIVLNDRVLFDSEKKINLTPQQRKVGYLFQQFALFPNMTVAENIAAVVNAKPKNQQRVIVAEKIKLLQLEGLEQKHPGQLSGGEQQRAALARILASEPQAILFDEPFSAMDSYLKWQLELKLADLLAEFLGTCLWVSHDRDEVYRNCEKICIIDNGRSEPVRSKNELFSYPDTMSAAIILGCKNYAQALSLDNQNLVHVPEWDLKLVCANPVQADIRYIGIHAHHLRPAKSDDLNQISCTVVRVIEDVFEMIVILQPEGNRADTAHLRMGLSKSEWKNLKEADRITVSVAPENILLLK